MKKTNYKTPPATIDTVELCKELVAHAAFAEPKLRDKIYKAVRQLQLLDKLAADAGLLHWPTPPPKHP